MDTYSRMTFGLLTACACFGQSLSVGAIGGVRGTDDLTGAGATSVSKRYVVGPALEIGLPLGFGVEVDALYRREGYQTGWGNFAYSVVSGERANSWEFPMLLKYHLPFPKIKPFLEAGIAPRTIRGTIRSEFRLQRRLWRAGEFVGISDAAQIPPPFSQDQTISGSRHCAAHDSRNDHFGLYPVFPRYHAASALDGKHELVRKQRICGGWWNPNRNWPPAPIAYVALHSLGQNRHLGIVRGRPIVAINPEPNGCATRDHLEDPVDRRSKGCRYNCLLGKSPICPPRSFFAHQESCHHRRRPEPARAAPADPDRSRWAGKARPLHPHRAGARCQRRGDLRGRMARRRGSLRRRRGPARVRRALRPPARAQGIWQRHPVRPRIHRRRRLPPYGGRPPLRFRGV